MEFKKGNIFESDADAIINPVNTVGIMGKGLAYQFKRKYPNNFKNYEKKCKIKEIEIGKDLVYTVEKGKVIINFPTKRNWRENSKIEYIKIGLKKLEELILKLDIKSIALPPIGAGNGKLDWNLVKNEILEFDKRISQKIKVVVYEPSLNEIKLGKGHYLIAYALIECKKMKIKTELTDLIFQKLIYLGDKSNYFNFKKELKGPFSKLLNIQYLKLKEYSRTSNKKITEIEKEMLKTNITENLQKEKLNLKKAVKIYINMKKFYNISSNNLYEKESKIELLSTLDFILKNENLKNITIENVYNKLKNWNKRKDKKYNIEDVNTMFDFMEKIGILEKNIFEEYIFKEMK